MGPMLNRKNNKKHLSKNKSVRIYREKKKKTDLFREQVQELIKQYDEIDSSKITNFTDFPLTDRTQRALKNWKYGAPTDIQKDSIGLALKGHDILGAAKTGSGKTLAFVIPVLECLFREGWSIVDGLGAMIITPTRELAYQIFEVFNKVGENHQFSIALVIGGKDLAKERKLLDKCNVVICTPGRILQHMDENPLFDAMNLKILVLDEADRILDLGFQKTVNAILENLPEERQTLLFSATQTKSVKDLARLSLKNPVYVSVHEHATHSTPEGLEQSYMVCDAQTKLDLLWSFLKSHRKQKILVFLASCKQVKYTYEIFCRMKPGLSVLALYGSLHQLRRMQIYDEFCRKNFVVMFATDVASRGLDFPNVNWVIQLDCPEDVTTYIHRAGRTARFQKGGEALLVLLPSEEESMIKQLQDRKIPITEIKVNPNKLFSVQKKMQALCAYDVNLKDSSQRAFKAYLKNIFLMKDKTTFDVTKLDAEAYAKSLGMAFAPRIRFVEKRLKNAAKNLQSFDSKDASSASKTEKNLLATLGLSDGDSDEEDFLKPKGKVVMMDSDIDEEIVKKDMEVQRSKKKPLTKAALAKRILKKNIKANTIIKYDDDGKAIHDVPTKQFTPIANELVKEMLEEGYNIEKAKLIMEKEDEIDKQLYKSKIKEKHKTQRRKLKELRQKEDGSTAPQLGDSEGENEESGSDIDPNNMSNSESETEQNDAVSGSSSSDSDNELLTSKKRKRNAKDQPHKFRKVHEDEETDDDIVIDTGLSVDDDESLALHYLTNT